MEQKVHCRAHNIPLLVSSHSQMNPDLCVTHQFCKVQFTYDDDDDDDDDDDGDAPYSTK
jgi:hypothetical protein